MSELGPGTLLADRFELLRRLGAGGLAEVFAARDRTTGLEVAVKVLHAHLAEEAEVAERFRRELSVTRGLDHPGIVRVYDLHEANGRPFFTMELLHGETLAERLQRGRVPPDEARRIAREVCAALEVAHRKGVVHRDLKPGNLFLCDSGAVKIVDFGLARVAGWARLTAQSTVMGTPGYLAPELLSGAGADPRADLYALGATLYELLTGKRAFDGADPYQVLRRQREGAPSPRAAVPSVTAADDALVRRALDPDPERRFQGAGQLLRELGGEVAPPSPVVPPAMIAGNLDVIVHGDLFKTRGLARVFAALGVIPNWGWKIRLRLMGKNTLAETTSRGTAEMLTTLCQEHGVGIALQPHRKRGRLRRWLRAQGARSALLLASGGAALGAWTVVRLLHSVTPKGELFHPGDLPSALLAVLLSVGLWFGFLFVLGLAMFGYGDIAPLQQLPSGDPAVRRLMDGIVRRVLKLRDRRDKAPPAQRILFDELIDAGERLRDAAAELANAAAVIDDPLAGPEVKAFDPAAIAARDAALARLLEMAASLDEALAVRDDLPSTTALLTRLREETGFARTALPQIEAARRGGVQATEPPPDPAAAAPAGRAKSSA